MISFFIFRGPRSFFIWQDLNLWSRSYPFPNGSLSIESILEEQGGRRKTGNGRCSNPVDRGALGGMSGTYSKMRTKKRRKNCLPFLWSSAALRSIKWYVKWEIVLLPISWEKDGFAGIAGMVYEEKERMDFCHNEKKGKIWFFYFFDKFLSFLFFIYDIINKKGFGIDSIFSIICFNRMAVWKIDASS